MERYRPATCRTPPNSTESIEVEGAAGHKRGTLVARLDRARAVRDALSRRRAREAFSAYWAFSAYCWKSPLCQ
jgi:hypothetical protein